MQNRPDKTALLEAVARFLEREVKPAIKDPSLAFRVLVASNLAAVVAAEIGAEDAATKAELERLARLLPDAGVDVAGAMGSREAQRAARERLNGELCARIRAGRVQDEALREAIDHVLLTLKDELRTSSPRFDTTPDME